MEIKEIFNNTAYALLYLTIAVIGAVAIVGLLIYFFKRDKFSAFKKCAFGVAIGFSICALVLMTYLKFESIKADDDVDNSEFAKLLYPILAEVIIAVVGGLASIVCSLLSKKGAKIARSISALGLLGGFVAIMVEMSKYYGVADYHPNTNLTGMIVSAVVFMAIIVVLYFVGDKRNISDTRSIVYGAISIAMSFALSYIRFFKMPQGGSVTFASLLPLMIYCCMFGTRRGVIACLIYGTLQAIQDPWIIHPMQFLLDYPLAFGVIGVSGIFIEKGVFKNKKVLGFLLGGIVCVILRYACHICSGVFAFADYADLEKYSTAVAYSFGYNSFTLVDMLIALAAGSMLFASKTFSSQMQKSSDLNAQKVSETVIINDEDDEIDKLILQTQNANAQHDDAQTISDDAIENNEDCNGECNCQNSTDTTQEND